MYNSDTSTSSTDEVIHESKNDVYILKTGLKWKKGNLNHKAATSTQYNKSIPILHFTVADIKRLLDSIKLFFTDKICYHSNECNLVLPGKRINLDNKEQLPFMRLGIIAGVLQLKK